MENRKEYFAHLTQIAAKVLKTLQKKNSDYVDRESDNPFENYELAADVAKSTPEQVMISRMVEKLTRASNLVKLDEKGENPAVNESLEDTITDVIGIAMMLAVYVSPTPPNLVLGTPESTPVENSEKSKGLIERLLSK